MLTVLLTDDRVMVINYIENIKNIMMIFIDWFLLIVYAVWAASPLIIKYITNTIL